MVDDDVEVGPGTELALPVGDGGERGDNEERPLNAHTVDLLQECDGLDGLSQAHLVCQDAVSSDERGKNAKVTFHDRGGTKKNQSIKELRKNPDAPFNTQRCMCKNMFISSVQHAAWAGKSSSLTI